MSNKVLSQNEIDELLQAIESCEKDTKSEERTRKVKIFDFKRPDIIGKSTIRILSNILEEYCVSDLETNFDIRDWQELDK